MNRDSIVLGLSHGRVLHLLAPLPLNDLHREGRYASLIKHHRKTFRAHRLYFIFDVDCKDGGWIRCAVQSTAVDCCEDLVILQRELEMRWNRPNRIFQFQPRPPSAKVLKTSFPFFVEMTVENLIGTASSETVRVLGSPRYELISCESTRPVVVGSNLTRGVDSRTRPDQDWLLHGYDWSGTRNNPYADKS